MEESRPLLFFNFRGGLLSSIFPKKSSKCLKTAILPLKPTKVDIFSRNCHFEALRVVFGKNGRKQTPPKMANFGGVYFLPFFPKTTLSASKWQFLENFQTSENGLQLRNEEENFFFQKGKFFFIFSTLANGHFGMLQTSLTLLEVP